MDIRVQKPIAGRIRVVIMLDPWQVRQLQLNREHRGAAVSSQVRIAVSRYLKDPPVKPPGETAEVPA